MTDGWDVTGIPSRIRPYVSTAFASEEQMAAGLLMSFLALKQVAAGLQGDVSTQLTEAVGSALDDFAEEYCGTPPRPLQALTLVAQLAIFARTLPEGSSVRGNALGLASQLAEVVLTDG